MPKNIAVIAAHPDDEVLGCGGTVARHADAGDLVSILILAEGLTSRDPDRNRDANRALLGHLAECAQRAGQILGAVEVKLLEFPDNRMDGVELLDVIKTIEDWLTDIRPSIVYTHHVGDVNVDHTVVHKAVVTACRPQPSYHVDDLRFFEVPSSTEWQSPGSATGFIPNLFIDVTSTLQRKLAALDAYQCEMRPWPHPRSIEAVEHLARWRGATVGVEAAEAFAIGRKIVR